MNSINDKQRARAAALAARNRISDSDRKQRSMEACRKLEEHFAPLFGPKATLAVYAAIGSEVDLKCLVHASYARSWRMCFPFMVKDDTGSKTPRRKREKSNTPSIRESTETIPSSTCVDNSASLALAHTKEGIHPTMQMEFYLIDQSQFEKAHEKLLAHPLHAWSRSELSNAGLASVSPEHVDGVVVPLVAFDAAGNRLGYGGGNYDRFLGALASAHPDAAVVGVAFAEQCIAHVPVDPHDLPLSTIVVV